jgi:hypothetical protein
MAYQQQFDPTQQPQFPAEGNNGGLPQGAPQQGLPQQPPQGIQPPAQGQEGGSPAPFAQQPGAEGSSGSVTGDAKTTLW